MKGSGDGGDNAGGRDKRGREMAENIPVDSPPSIDGDSDDQDDDSKASRRSTLDCLDSLEASLPMKRGLSSHYHGKSKSFGNLHELGSENAKDLGKKECPVNKRRRLQLAHEFSDHAPNSSMTHISSLPVFPSPDQYKKDEDEEDDTKGRNQDQQYGK